jgi:hypothetical protein
VAVTQLSLYNDALMLCGERFLANLAEEREPRRLLDQAWSSGNGAVTTCLEIGQWNFAMRAAQIDYDTNITPGWGYNRAFSKPTDWVLTSGLCCDEFFRVPLTHYIDETGYWYSDIDTIYVRYVSDDPGYGSNMNAWPDSFREVVAEFLCSKIVRKLSNSDAEEEKSFERMKRKVTEAKNKALMAEPTMFPARGVWGLARQRFSSRRDGGGSSGNLIG